MNTKGSPQFFLEPVAYVIAIFGAALFLLILLFIVGLVILPIAAFAVVGVLLFRHHQFQKMKVKITAPMADAVPSPPALSDSQDSEQEEYLPFSLEEFAQEIDGRLLAYIEKPTGRFSCKPLSDAFTTVATQLYAEEAFNAPPPPPAPTDLITLAKYQDEFDRWKQLRDDPSTFKLFLDTVAGAYMTLRDHFPAFAIRPEPQPDASPFTATLQLSIEPHQAIQLAAKFFLPEVKEKHLFARLREQIATNNVRIEAARDEPTFDELFADTPLTGFSGIALALSIPDETRFSGHWIIAPPGRGKTTLLHAMVQDDLAKDASLIFIDSKGDLIDPIKNLQSIKDRLLLIEPTPDAVFALNPLDVSHASVVQVVNLIEYILAGLLDAKFTALQSTLFRNVVPAIVEAFPNPTLDIFKDVMGKGLPSLEKLNPHARQFFENRETGFHSKTYESTRKEVVWRLDYLMSNPTLRSMFSATQTKLDIGREMDAGKVIIINNSKAILGDEGAEFFGRFFVALIARAAQQRAGRPASSKKSCYVYIDECQSVIAKDTRIPVLLDECRSQKIALILCHQRTAQLTPPVLDAVANCAIRMANSDDEAKYLAPKLRMDVEALQSLPRGTFGTFVRDLTPQGIQLRISKLDLDGLPRMTEAEIQAVRGRMRAQFSQTAAPPAASSAPTAAGAPPHGASSAAAPAPVQHAPDDSGEPADSWGKK